MKLKHVSKHLKPINYERWAELEFNDDLTEAEQCEKAALEERNMEIIERVYQRLRKDKEIQAHIEKIKAHEWVKVVEGQK